MIVMTEFRLSAILIWPILSFVLITNGAEFAQKDYNIVSDRLVVDKEYKEWADITSTNTKYNRTQRTFSLSLNIHKAPHPSKVMARVQAYRFTSNVYKLFAPIKFTINACEALRKNSFGVGEFRDKFGNFTNCPLKPGVFAIHDYIPDEDKMPPYVPEGKYRIALELLSDKEPVGAISWYGAIVKKKKF